MRGISKEHVLEIGSTHSRPHGHREKIDDLLGLSTEQMSAQYLVGAFLHKHLETRMRFPNPPRRVPAAGHLHFDSELQSSLSCLAFAEAHSSQGWNREHHCWNARIIRLLAIPLQQVRRYDDAFVASHRSKGRASTCSSIACCINSRIRYTLQEFIDVNTPFAPFDSGFIQVHVVDFRHATRGMDDHVCLESALLTRSRGLNNELTGASFNAYDFRAELNVNTKLAATLDNLIDQVRVKLLERASPSMNDGDLRPGTRRDMSEFKRYIPASNKQNPLWKFIQVQEPFARCKVLRPMNL